MDLARSVQVVCEEVMLRMARARAPRRPARSNLCLAGGVALNCVGNGRILREGKFDDIWIQPAAGDAGGALGAALPWPGTSTSASRAEVRSPAAPSAAPTSAPSSTDRGDRPAASTLRRRLREARARRTSRPGRRADRAGRAR